MSEWPRLKLWWDDPNTNLRHELISELPITIGRDASNTLVLNSTLVSRQHAELFADGQSLRIRDVSSTNGIKVNGKLIQQAVLRQGDNFKVGPFYFNWGFDLPVEGEENLDSTIVETRPYPVEDDATQLLPPPQRKKNLGDRE